MDEIDPDLLDIIEKNPHLFEKEYTITVSDYGEESINKKLNLFQNLILSSYENQTILDYLFKKIHLYKNQINSIINNMWSPLMIVCTNIDHYTSEFAKLLLDNGANPNINIGDDTILMAVCRTRYTHTSVDTVKLLLEYGAKLNIQDDDGSTALMMAVEYSYSNTMPYENECDVDIISDHYNKIIELMLKYGADPNIQNNDGETALIIGFGRYDCISCSYNILSTLLKYNADPNFKNSDGYTALILSVKYLEDPIDTKNIIKLFLEYNADPNIQDKNGYTVLIHLCISRRNYSKESVEILLDYDVDPNIQSYKKKYNALMLLSGRSIFKIEKTKNLIYKTNLKNKNYKNNMMYNICRYKFKIFFIKSIMHKN
jgi:ankyrin repeat protein